LRRKSLNPGRWAQAFLAATLALGCSNNGASTDAMVASRDTGADQSADQGAWQPTAPTEIVAMFHLNVQDYGYLDESAATLTKALDLFASLGLPADVYLTTWITDEYEKRYPALLQRLLTTSQISLSYHIRPPKPYRANFNDWYGLSSLSSAEQIAAIKNYESYGLNLTTGKWTTAEGGFAKLKRLYGRAPFVGGISPPAELSDSVNQVFWDMGLRFVVEHGPPSTLGDKHGPFYLKPEAIDVKAFQFDGTLDGDACLNEADGGKLYDCEIARCAAMSIRPCTVAFKMHDNDFFAEESWWLAVYSKKTPDWDPTQKAALLPICPGGQTSTCARDQLWNRYEQIVRRAAELRSTHAVLAARDWEAALP
jgi:hypothetical protein